MSKCEWPAPPCPSQKARPVEFVNVFGEKVRTRYCPEHIAIAQDPEKMADLHERARTTWHRMGAKISPEQMRDAPIQRQLTAHNETCVPCGMVALWIREELGRNRIKGQADVERIGKYVQENCCSVGVMLNYEAGKEMQKAR